MKKKFEMGIWFWFGAGAYSLVNLIQNLRKIDQTKLATYNAIILSAAIIAIITFSILRKSKK